MAALVPMAVTVALALGCWRTARRALVAGRATALAVVRRLAAMASLSPLQSGLPGRCEPVPACCASRRTT
jgi:hypothetical protein